MHNIAFLLQIIFCLTFSIGFWAYRIKLIYKPDSWELKTDLFDVSFITLVISGIVIFTSFIGCIGSLRLNVNFLRLFVIIVSLGLVVKCIIFFSVTFKGNFIRGLVENYIGHETIQRYREDDDLRNLVDWIQLTFKCCGIHGLKDWNSNIYYKCFSDNPSVDKCAVPSSCCKKMSNDRRCGSNMLDKSVRSFFTFL